MEHNHEQNYETFGTLQQTHIFFETIGFNAVQYFYQKQNYLLVDGVFVRDMGASIYKMLQVKKKTKKNQSLLYIFGQPLNEINRYGCFCRMFLFLVQKIDR